MIPRFLLDLQTTSQPDWHAVSTTSGEQVEQLSKDNASRTVRNSCCAEIMQAEQGEVSHLDLALAVAEDFGALVAA